MARGDQWGELSAAGDFAGALDSGLDFVRAGAAWVLPLYTLAVAPTALVMLPLIGAIAVHRPGSANLYLWLLLAAMVWRWCILAVLQQQVRRHVGAAPDRWLLVRRLPAIVLTRLLVAAAVVWGSWLLVVPGLPALMLAPLVAPVLLEAPNTALKHVAIPLLRTVTTGSTWRSFLSLLLLLGVLYMGLWATLDVFAGVVIPSFMGVADNSLSLRLGSEAVALGVLFVIWMAFDLVWHVSAVLHFYHLRARHNGGDLQLRLERIREAAA